MTQQELIVKSSFPIAFYEVRRDLPAFLAASATGISLPVGLTSAGLPVGMEIDGPEQSDRRLLAVARTLESVIHFSARPTKPEPEASP
jgi:Asp-tRNA(Asn)/Glu-tRNA(Gln) amidotransferase A subunit family amidase